MTEIQNMGLASAEFFVLIMIAVILLVDLFIAKKFQVLTYFLTQITLVIAALITTSFYSLPDTVIFHGHYTQDTAGTILKLFIYATSFFVFLYSRDYVKEREMPFGDYYVLSLICVLGMMVLVSAHSLITLYLGLELLSLPLYALIALRRHIFSCQEAAMKFFIMGALASGLLLYGFSMIYGATKSILLNEIYQAITQLPADEHLILIFGLVFVVVGIAFKLGAVPFHMWVPDVYDGAPNTVTLLIATAPKIAAFGLAIRLLVQALPELHIDWQHMLIIISILSMALGNLVAIVQSNIKRMLAYSSIAHIGYMFLGFIAATPQGYAAAMFYIITYAIMGLGAFGMIVLLSRAGIEVNKVEDFRGLNQRNPWLAFMMLLIMFSMAGVPPMVGFMAKVAVLEAVVSVQLTWLAILGVIFAIIGVYYYLRIVKAMYFDSAEDLSPIVVPTMDMQLAITVNGLVILLLGLFPGGLFEMCRAAF